jgi:hypothetical protein
MNLEDELRDIIEQMKVRGVKFEAGLSDEEVSDIEQRCNFRFPPDLKMFLQLAVPIKWEEPNSTYVSDRFPNWHKDPVEIMEWSREWAIGTFSFDIESERNNFWMSEWGKKPSALVDQLAIATAHIQNAPLLIPIYEHRFLPAEPCEAGNPVFSIYQAIDSIPYGYNLQKYLQNEFINRDNDVGRASDYRTIRFWSKITMKYIE